MRELVVSRGKQPLIGVIEEGRLVEAYPDGEDSAAESVILGRVERIVPGMKAAFVEIGQEKNGFLPLEEMNTDLPRLQAGDHVLVQVHKEAQGSKGAFLTRHIILCGMYVMLIPLATSVGVSTRITQEGQRRRLKELALEITGGQFGLVMRTAALDAMEEDIREETASLLESWQQAKKAAPTAHAPSIIFQPRTTLDRVLDDYRPRGIDKIWTNDALLAESLRDVAPVCVTEDVLAVTKMGSQLKKALDRRVWLDSGGTLIIDPCEAMTVIDVNTAKFTGKRDLQETILKLNLEACGEIARQIRLRNLSGIIIIDMIDMTTSEARRQVLSALEEALKADRVKTVVHGFTSLGLVEMTRKRSRPPLRAWFCQEENDG